jgi:hypothetical protein
MQMGEVGRLNKQGKVVMKVQPPELFNQGCLLFYKWSILAEKLATG